MSHYAPQHVSSSTLLIIRRTNCITTASGIVTLCKQPYSTRVESGLQYSLTLKWSHFSTAKCSHFPLRTGELHGFEDRLVYRILQMRSLTIIPRTPTPILHHELHTVHDLSFHILPQSPFRKHSIIWPWLNERRIDSSPHLVTAAVYQSQSL